MPRIPDAARVVLLLPQYGRRPIQGIIVVACLSLVPFAYRESRNDRCMLGWSALWLIATFKRVSVDVAAIRI